MWKPSRRVVGGAVLEEERVAAIDAGLALLVVVFDDAIVRYYDVVGCSVVVYR